jgi:CHAT domain-containing protein/tetratricopeptide (TPR) repeat protein
LEEAARLHRAALATRSETQRAQCLEDALTIYTRLGRLQQVIQVGGDYGPFLWSKGAFERLRDLDLLLGECYLALGHYPDAERHLEQAVRQAPGVAPIQPAKRVAALAHLAWCAEKRGDGARASRLWQQLEEFAVGWLDSPRSDLTPRQRIECAWKLADGYRFHKRPDKAIPRLLPLLVFHRWQGDLVGQRDTLRRLAGHHAAGLDYPAAEKCLREARDLHTRAGAADRITLAELADELAAVLAAQKKDAEAARWRERAAEEYQAILNPSREGRPEVGQVVTAFWELQTLYEKSSQYGAALRLADGEEVQWGGVLSGPKLKSQQGTLRVILNRFEPAHALLKAAVTELEQQSPRNYVDLPRAYNNLAIVEQANGNLDEAERLARSSLELYEWLGWPTDRIVVEASNLLGTCAAERGRYAEALMWFESGTDVCEKLGRPADPQRSIILLNKALVYKSQGELKPALRDCEEAREVYRGFAAPDALGFAAFDAARASLHASLHEFDTAHKLAEGVRDRCAHYEIEKGPLVVIAWHCQGLYHLSCRQFAKADKAWNQVRSLQEKEKNSLLLPRTLNYLGLTAEVRSRTSPDPGDELRRAEGFYEQARKLQESPRAFPVTHFITLWRLAGLAERRGDREAARDLLGKAVGVVEKVRVLTYGSARQRATYFAQCEPGFDQMVDLCVRDGRVEEAFRTATRVRSRAALDQLHLAGVDPRAALQGPRGDELRRQEAALRVQISHLQAKLQVCPEDDVRAEVKAWRAELDRAQNTFEKVWQQFLTANDVYHAPSEAAAPGEILAALRDRVLGRKGLVLAYYIGRERSYLLLLGDGTVEPQAFPLTVPADVAERVGPPAAASGAGRRGEPLPLNQSLARELVKGCRLGIDGSRDRGPRTLEGRPRDRRQAATSVGLDRLGDVLLPPAVLRRIEEIKPDGLVVIPDGPLHRLPLEALVIDTPRGPRYVLDELPPIAYAPSAAVLVRLAQRRPPDAAGPFSLLTVSDPEYPPEVTRLEGTATESEAIRRFFPPQSTTSLTRAAATRGAVRAAVAGQRVVHLAAHGLAEERIDNLFGAVALTPTPARDGQQEDNGRLYLHEIYTLPLKDCELAVLSACDTNVGPQPPLEAGVTLASGFLAAGARRVVASHWKVNDASTARLMEVFFREVTDAARKGERVHYARALQRARREVRQTPGWSAPFYWAPFVLLGPGD